MAVMLQGHQRRRHVASEVALTWLVLTLLGCGSPTPQVPVEPAPVAVAMPVPPPPELPDPTTPRLAASHVLISWSGAPQAPKTVTRTRDEAMLLATKLHARAPTDSDNFAAFAEEYSDGPSALRGGQLGVWLTGTMVPNFERHVASVEPGSIAALCETPFGFHIIRREAVVQIRVRHVLVTWEGAHQSESTRSQTEARTRIETARQALADGTSFAQVANTYGDDSTSNTGGDLGLIAPGQMVPDFEDAAFKLAVGQTSGVVQTPYGFHLIERTE